MTLDDLKKLFGESINKAHFVLSSMTQHERVESVAVRLDSDGVISLVFYAGYTKGRTATTESQDLKNAMELYKRCDKTTVEDFDSCYLDWETLEDVLDGYAYPEDTDDYDIGMIPKRIATLLKDRNSLASEVEKLRKESQAQKPKTNRKMEEKEIDLARSVVFDHLSKNQLMQVSRIVKDCAIPAGEVDHILKHEWFEKTKSGWRIAVKESSAK